MEQFMRETLGDELTDAIFDARKRVGDDLNVEIDSGLYNVVRRKPNSPDRHVKDGIQTASEVIEFLRGMKK